MTGHGRRTIQIHTIENQREMEEHLPRLQEPIALSYVDPMKRQRPLVNTSSGES
jgi:hypothetical protein